MILQTPPAPTAVAPALHDIHLPPAPSWWPPAPGWWVLAALASILLIWLCTRTARRLRQRQRVRLILHEFDCAITAAANPPAALAAASALLRRAARQRDPAATQLQGDPWLTYLDGTDSTRPFSRGAGRILVDGLFDRSADATQTTTALRMARTRLHELLMSPGLMDAGLTRAEPMSARSISAGSEQPHA